MELYALEFNISKDGDRFIHELSVYELIDTPLPTTKGQKKS